MSRPIITDLARLSAQFGAAAAFGLLLAATAAPASAQAIYPIDRADILAGAMFDLKVEFDGIHERGTLKVTIDGEDASTVFGQPAQVIEREDGQDLTAYWLRGVSLNKAGTYRIEARIVAAPGLADPVEAAPAPASVAAASPGAATTGATPAGNLQARSTSRTVTWTVYDTPKGRIAKNVILMVGDGMSNAHRVAARMLSKGIREGKYGGELAMDDMPHMALVSTSGSDSIVTDSANSASAYTTGHKTCVNALGVYCARNTRALDHPKVENLSELARRRHGLALGVVTDTEIQDATPAAMVAHTRRRTDYEDIVVAFHKIQPEVILGGGWPTFLPATHPEGKRADNVDYVSSFITAGYTYVQTRSVLDIEAARGDTRRLLGLFNRSNIDGALDRRVLKKGTVPRYPDQPDLTDQLKAALQVLSRHEAGFVLLIEAGRIDKYSHSLDWERAVFDTIMLDNAVKIAKDFAAQKNDTLVVVIADHTHPAAIIGTYGDNPSAPAADSTLPRDRLRLYQRAGFPEYPAAGPDGYPDSVDVSRRLAFVFAGYPDHCDAGRPYLAGENKPAVIAPGTSVATANEANCAAPGVARRVGNLPFAADRGIHSAEDVIVTAMGPGAEQFRGRMDNTGVFRAMATALGLGPSGK